ncbi:deaminase domain-containing protein [Avibacterium endocarditidis]|uniref:deaminase domain-containing protein n=1 Tax=Avibacterium TaxID=292486 RepID=UPI0039FC8CD9
MHSESEWKHDNQGGSVLTAVAGAETAKRAVENNYLSSLDVEHFIQELEKAQKEGRDTKPIIEKYQKISAENRQELLACNGNVLCESGHLYQMNAGAEEVERNLGFFSRMTVPYPNNLNENNRILLSTLVEQENANSFNQLSSGTKIGLSAIELGAAIGGTGLITKDSLGKFKLSSTNANSKLPVVGKTENYENQTSKIHISSGAENVALYPKLKKELAQQEKAGFEKVIKDLSVKPEGSVLLLPEYRQKLSDAKAGLPIKLQIKGNAAIAHIDVEGIQTKFLAGHSGIDTITGDFIGKGKTVFTSLTLPSKSGRLIDRKTDSEYKILSNLADQLGTNIGAKGQITIFTERPACKSCLGVAEQFNKRYPNIKVNIFDNNGNVVKPLNGEK